jgi:MFS transporter, DHA1 family, multidrug/chloramphenicol efflux transport protein
MFALFSVISALAFWGLWRSMPETATGRDGRFSMRRLLADYREVFTNKGVVMGSLAIGFITLPLLAWVAQSPVLLIQDAGMTPLQYGWLQVPVFTGLIIGNIILSKISGKVNIRTPVCLGIVPIVLGLSVSAFAAMFMAHAWYWMTGGLSLYALGTGLVNAGLYRLTLFSSPTGKGTVAAALGLMTIVVFATGIEIAKQLYFALGNGIFMLAGLIAGVAGTILIAGFLKHSLKKA